MFQDINSALLEHFSLSQEPPVPFKPLQSHPTLAVSRPHSYKTPKTSSSSLEAFEMSIQFDPFSFGVAAIALAVAVIQLYWNRPHRHHTVSQCPSRLQYVWCS